MKVKPTEVEEGLIFGKLRLWQAIERRWAGILSPLEVRVLQRILDMTAGWNRDTVVCSYSRLVGGRDGAGEWAYPPLGISDRQARRALVTIRSHGVVKVVRLQVGLRLTIDRDLLLSGPAPQAVHDDRVPVGHTERTEGTVRSACETDLIGLHGRQNTGRSSQEENTSNSSQEQAIAFGSADRVFSLDSISRQQSPPPGTSDFDQAVRRVRMAKPGYRRGTSRHTVQDKGDRLDLGDLRLIWESAWAEAFTGLSGPPAWGGKERGQLRGIFNRWCTANGNFDEFLTWVISSWSATTSMKLGWVTKKGGGLPEFPDVGLLAAFVIHFEDAWMTRRRRQFLQTSDLNMFQRLRANGVSEMEAIDEIAQRKVNAALRSHKSAPRTMEAPRQPQGRLDSTRRPAAERPRARILGLQNIRKSGEEMDRELWGERPSAPSPDACPD